MRCQENFFILLGQRLVLPFGSVFCIVVQFDLFTFHRGTVESPVSSPWKCFRTVVCLFKGSFTLHLVTSPLLPSRKRVYLYTISLIIIRVFFYLLLSPNPKAVRLSANSWAYVRVLRVALCGFRVLTTCAHQNSVATLSRYLHRCRDHVQRQLVNLILPLIFNCE